MKMFWTSSIGSSSRLSSRKNMPRCAHTASGPVPLLNAVLIVFRIFANARTILAVKASLVRTEEDLAECTAQLKGAKEALTKSEVELATAKAEKDQLELTLATQWQELTDKASQVDHSLLETLQHCWNVRMVPGLGCSCWE